MKDTLELVSAVLGTGANGIMIILGWVLLKHELRITKLEGRNG